MDSELNPIVLRFVEHIGNTTQSFGAGRVIGQIYAYLYFSSSPRNLGNMQQALGISKGSASTAVRQLQQWGAVRKVWVKGDRKDYYEAIDWFGQILKKAIADTVGKKLSSYTSLLAEIGAELASIKDEGGDGEFIKSRLERLREFQMKTEKLWDDPIVQGLLR
jgi:HTH-type transcriptional regulator, glycine betaine synthesis regulator